jgi:acyl-CoA dehydrogenase
MDFAETPRVRELSEKVWRFMDERIRPAEDEYWRGFSAETILQRISPVMEELKTEARRRGLWNLFLPDKRFGAGLTNLEYGALAEIMGWSPIASEAMNCSAPDTGNMEVLAQFGTPEQQETWLAPLLAGEIRSCIGMSEPEVASSDPTQLATRIDRDGSDYVINGHKWFTSGAAHPNAKVILLIGMTHPDAERHARHTMVLVPMDAPGVTIVRQLKVFGFDDPGSHCEVVLDNVRVPQMNRIGDEGTAFMIAQARLGPGRLHHCMRLIGAAERALSLMCERAKSRTAFGKRLAEQGVVREQIAKSRIEIEQARLLCQKAAWLLDTQGSLGARFEISAIKVVAPNVAQNVIDRSIQVHGGAGVSQDLPLTQMFAYARSARFMDGPDEVHYSIIGREELKREEGRA